MSTMERYHMRRSDKEFTDPLAVHAVIDKAQHMTLALCRGDEPYLVTVSYAFDAQTDTFYFHCATDGKKLDILAANPRVWGQVLLDDGYLDGRCNNAYRTVQFSGVAERVDTRERKAAALAMMIDKLESDPPDVKARKIEGRDLANVCIVAVRAKAFTGKICTDKKKT